jgi:very-short-patch-repair endonuclease
LLTHSELERLFPPLARRAGLPRFETQRVLGTSRVDFYVPDLKLVIECDSLRYHRTPSRQASDTRRDHAHWRAGREPIRLTHHQIAHEADYVVDFLSDLVSLAS